MPDPNSDILYAALECEFGRPIHGWPRPDTTLVDRTLVAVGQPATDNAFLIRFRDERQHGQLTYVATWSGFVYVARATDAAHLR